MTFSASSGSLRRTKIIATLGPASAGYAAIEGLYQRGVNVFRLNMSHGTKRDHKASFDAIRKLEAQYNAPVGIIMDLQGPKFRIGTFAAASVTVCAGASFILHSAERPGTSQGVCLPHPKLLAALKTDDILLLDDGNVELLVTHPGTDHIKTRVIRGGILSNHKGVNAPSLNLNRGALTEKDRRDIQLCNELGPDFVALSFVQSKSDIMEARSLIDKSIPLISKIEKPKALDNLEEIIQVSDGILIARGDLGVELPAESLPIIQKRIVRQCREAGKPVAIATQMLESMIKSPRPTRAEVSDVANGVFEGADAVMLSAETAKGQYPMKAVEMMGKIISSVESDGGYQSSVRRTVKMVEATFADAITSAAVQAAETMGSAGIVSFTASGTTSHRIARLRPATCFVSITPHWRIARRLCLLWGTLPVVSNAIQTYAQMVRASPELLKDLGLARKGETLVMTAGEPLGTPGGTNVLKILEIA